MNATIMPNPYEKPYLRYLILLELIITQINYPIVIILNLRTLFYLKCSAISDRVRLAPILQCHLWVWLFVACATLVNNIYMLAFWRIDETIYEPKFFFISAGVYICVQALPAVVLFYSTIERCLIFKYGLTKHLKQVQYCLLALCIFSMSGIAGNIIEALIYSAPNPFPATTECMAPGCMSRAANDRLNATRITIAMINLIAGFILYYFIRNSHLFTPGKNHTFFAKLTMRALFFQTASDLIIHGIAYAVSIFFNDSASNLLGIYPRMFSSTDGLICGIIYAFTIKKIQRRTNPNNVQKANSSFTRIS
uniref:Vomeronasal type-1 receptor n=1 Tax=Panagrolaimus sp. JU765 TaxID=591449 RepID=A0AC34QLT0_9BILA